MRTFAAAMLALVLAVPAAAQPPEAVGDSFPRDDVVWLNILEHTAVERLLSHERVNADIWIRRRPLTYGAGLPFQLVYFKYEDMPATAVTSGEPGHAWVARRISFTEADVIAAMAGADRDGVDAVAKPKNQDSAGAWPARFEVAARVHARYEVAWPEACPAVQARLRSLNPLLAQRLAVRNLPGEIKTRPGAKDGEEIVLGARGVLASAGGSGWMEVGANVVGPVADWSSATLAAIEPCWKPDAERPFL